MKSTGKTLTFLLVLTFIQLSGCGDSRWSPKEIHADGLSPSVYYIPVIDPKNSKMDCHDSIIPLKVTNKDEEISLCETDIDNCRMQGSCVIITSRGRQLYHFKSGEGAQSLFTKGDLSRCPYGMGVKNICLDPYYSVAADPLYFQTGDVLFVDQLVGLLLANGDVHDGYVIVRDQGGAIKGTERFDFFIGFDDPYDVKNIFVRQGLGDPKTRFSFHRVSGDIADSIRKNRAYPGLPSK